MAATLLLAALLPVAVPSSSASPAAPAGGARFSNVFASSMVLQRGKPIEVWGFGASPSASALTVHLGPDMASAYWPVAADGSWKAVLPAIHGFGCN
jgi:hypothetical protein